MSIEFVESVIVTGNECCVLSFYKGSLMPFSLLQLFTQNSLLQTKKGQARPKKVLL